jgi:hypothetical protein
MAKGMGFERREAGTLSDPRNNLVPHLFGKGMPWVAMGLRDE